MHHNILKGCSGEEHPDQPIGDKEIQDNISVIRKSINRQIKLNQSKFKRYREEKMNQSIGQKFNVISLLRFAAPSIIMMVFMSLYTIIDGFFIARYAGSAALSAANIVYPVVNVLYACGIMFATGGSAIVAKKLGQQKEKEARNDFTSIVVVGLLISILFLVFGTIFTEPLSKALGSNAMLLPDCKRYLRTLLLFAPASMLQMLFQMFFVTAGKPGLGLGVTIAGGVANAIFDYVFMAVCHMDINRCRNRYRNRTVDPGSDRSDLLYSKEEKPVFFKI